LVSRYGKDVCRQKALEKLRATFYDTDDLIEAALGRSIREMVVENGWVYFREREKEIIRDAAAMQGGLLLPSGAVMDEENAELLKNHGILIWLDADVETIVQRIQNDSRSDEKGRSFR